VLLTIQQTPLPSGSPLLPQLGILPAWWSQLELLLWVALDTLLLLLQVGISLHCCTQTCCMMHHRRSGINARLEMGVHVNAGSQISIFSLFSASKFETSTHFIV
jgi:hypothetical protein